MALVPWEEAVMVESGTRRTCPGGFFLLFRSPSEADRYQALGLKVATFYILLGNRLRAGNQGKCQ